MSTTKTVAKNKINDKLYRNLLKGGSREKSKNIILTYHKNIN